MSSPFPRSILNGTFFSFRITTRSKWSKSRLSEINYNKDSSRITVLMFFFSLILAVRLCYCSVAHQCVSLFPVFIHFLQLLSLFTLFVTYLLHWTQVHEFHISYTQPEWYLFFPTVQLQVHSEYSE